MELTKATLQNIDIAMEIINCAKKHLKEQGIDQWQTGYPDYECIKNDAITGKGFFVTENAQILGYLCIDFDGEAAYNTLQGTWASNDTYVVAHRMAFNEHARGKNLAGIVFSLVERMASERGVHYFRVDTDEGNKKMQHILQKNGFAYRGIITFDNSEKIAFDKHF